MENGAMARRPQATAPILDSTMSAIGSNFAVMHYIALAENAKHQRRNFH
jgi:hypothetical protein